MSYEQDAINLDKELAELLGWKIITERLTSFPNVGVVYKHCFISGINPNYPYGDNFELPCWTQNDAAAFQLMVEHEIDVMNYHEGMAALDTDYPDTQCGVLFKDFPSKQDCVRFAIVHAVVNKLKGI